MNKLDFLRRLDKELSVLDKEERKEILAFYEERFYTGTIYENKTEEEVIAELERPEVIAKNVLEEYGVSPKYVAKSEERYSNISSGQVVGIIIFDVLVASWLIPTLISLAFSILGSSLSYFGVLTLLIGEITTVDEFVFAFMTAAYVLYFLFGLVVLGASLFAVKSIIVWHLNVFKIKGRDKWIKKLSKWSVDGWFKRHRGLNQLKNILLVGSLVTIGYTGFWIFNHYDWVEAEYNGGEVQVETINEDFTTEIVNGDEWTIVTDFGNMDIEVVLTDSEEVTITHTYYEDDEFTYDFDYENNVITLTSEDNNVYFITITDIFKLFSQEYKVRIEVPSDLVLDTTTLSTENGDVDIRNVNIRDIDITSTNGEVTINNVENNESIRVDTTNGSIYLRNINSVLDGVITLSTTNGSIDIETTNAVEYYLDTTNGSIDLSSLNEDLHNGDVLEASTTNGSVKLQDVYIDDIDLETTNGDITFFNTDTSYHPSNYDKSSTNGSVTTNVTEH